MYDASPCFYFANIDIYIYKNVFEKFLRSV